MKKKMYYNMRIKTVYRNLAQVISKMDMFQQHMLNFPHERLRALVSAMKEVSNNLYVQMFYAQGFGILGEFKVCLPHVLLRQKC